MDNINIKILQWNARSAIANSKFLCQLKNEIKFDVAILSETWFKPNSQISMKKYNIIHKDRPGGKGGVAIYIKNIYKYDIINFTGIPNDLETCGINVHLNDTIISVVSIYRPPNVKVSQNDWNSLFSQLSNYCIIGGDFNAHHGLWGSSIENQAGKILCDAIGNTNNLTVLNDGSQTRLTPPGGLNSCVDISIVSGNISSHMTWEVLDNTYGSDHFPIILKWGKTSESIIYPSVKWREKDADWDTYRMVVSNSFFNIPTFSTTDKKIEFLLSTINTAATASMPENKPFIPKSRTTPWWDNDCTVRNNERKEAFKRYKSHASIENFIACKKITSKCKLLFKRKAKESWKKFCSELSSSTPSNIVWLRVRNLQSSKKKTPCQLSQEKIEELLDKMAPPTVDINLTPTPQPNNNENWLAKPIEIEELLHHIKKGRNSSPGADSITYNMIYQLPYVAKEFLCEIFNNIWLLGANCSLFKICNIILIHKTGKDPSSIRSYRPISLMSCIFKTFERIIKSRLEWWIENNNLFPNTQYGFRRGKGTVNCLTHLVTDIQCCLSENKYLSAIFLDIHSAYDNVDLHILIEKLTYIKVPKFLAINLIKLYLEREISIKVNNRVYGPRKISSGLPQGSVLSPILFNIYTKDFHHIWDDRITVLQYADDFVIYSKNNSIGNCHKDLKHIMYVSHEYFSNNGFSISAEKSAVVYYTSMTISGYNISILPSYKYLGLIVDTKLTWKEHIFACKVRCEQSINILKMVTNKKWGADPAICLLFYRAYIRSIIDYGCTLYGSTCTTTLSILDRIQYKSLRISLGAFRSTPVQSLLVAAGEPPLDNRRSFLANKFMLRMRVLQDSIVTKCTQLNIHNLTGKYWIHKKSPPLADAIIDTAVYENSVSKTTKLPVFIFPYEISYTRMNIIFQKYSDQPIINGKLLMSVLADLGQSLHLYTDGSKNNAGVGCAVYIAAKNISLTKSLTKETSIFSAEAEAIRMALEYVLTDDCYQNFVILSDSKSVLTALNNKNPASLNNISICDILHKHMQVISQNKKIYLIWVPAHNGIPGNNKVDQLAKLAASGTTICNATNNYMDLVNEYKKKMKENWQTHWTNIIENKKLEFEFLM